LADRRDLDLLRTGDDLVLAVGPWRRVLALPAVLHRCRVVGAAFDEGRLRISFEPDPARGAR
jgi:arsenite-transporting ATPase